VYIESEAVAVNRASDAHGHIKDHNERSELMLKTMDSERERRWPYFHLLAVTAGVNVIVAGVGLAAAYRSKSRELAEFSKQSRSAPGDFRMD
jgi:hypothetical protein